MFRRLMFLSLQIVAYGSYLSAQDMTNAQLTAEIKSIKSQLAGVSSNVTKTLDVVNENASQVQDLKIQVNALTDRINEELRKQQQILDAISERDTTGRYVPRLVAAMESDTFRKDMENAVHRSIRTQGDFEVTNKTNNYTRILVNRIELGINPGEKHKLKVPVGTVTTQLPGREKETWTITAPNYWEGIEIVLLSPPVSSVASPPVYTSPPNYVNPPISSNAPFFSQTYSNSGLPITYR